MSDNLTQILGLNLSKDPETEGFDLQAGETWIYPTNYPVREYQFNITQKALLKNTLVSLPTGLGKTFIAAVVMFNFFRWYPLGKIIFMAPTRPLVKQQIDACYDIMAIPKDCTVEITGTKLSNSREEIWKKKRVFFITPQILQNDLDRFESLGPTIKCLVFDEAHRARGNYAYCEVIRKLLNANKFFRVLALSATPGGSINDVLEVVQNLLISHLEFRIEESLDVSPYVFRRNLTTVVVPLGDKLQEVKDTYMKVLEYYTRTLIKYKIIQGNCANLTKGKVFMLLKHYQTQNRGTSSNYAEIMKSLNICITLYHAAELLIRHGLRSFSKFFQEHIDKPLFRGNNEIRAILKDVEEYMGPLPQIQQLPDGEYPQIPEDLKFGHPKYYKLRDILVVHFKETGDSSRAIVFFEYRESVMEACMLLIQSQPMLRPRIFIGQKQGVTQKSQINVVKAFREGRCNVLLSTSIGEEGLDVGEVDLIVCFDISNKSPIRIVQRMGRTGRKKDGNVVVLVTEGKEQQTLKDCLIHKNNVAFHVLGSNEITKGLKYDCPRLVPDGLVPRCEKIFITVEKQDLKKSDLKGMLKTLSSRSSEPTFSPDLMVVDIEEKIPAGELLLTKENLFDENQILPNIFSKRIEKQRNFQEIHKIEHSSKCEILVNLLQLAESKRFNIPMSQLDKTVANKNLKQADIRHMFFKSQSANDFITPPFTQVLPDSGVQLIDVEDKNFGDPELFEELKHFLSIKKGEEKICRLCPSQFNCRKKLVTKKSAGPVLKWVELDDSVYLDITEQDFKRDNKCQSFQFEDSMNFQLPETPVREQKTILELEDLVDESILSDFNKTSFEAPKTFKKLLKQYSDSLIDEEDTKNHSQKQKFNSDTRSSPKLFTDEKQTLKLDSLFKTTRFEAPKTFKKLLNQYSDSLIDEEDTKNHSQKQKFNSDTRSSPKLFTDDKQTLKLDSLFEKTSFEAPKTFKKLLNQYSYSLIDEEDTKNHSQKQKFNSDTRSSPKLFTDEKQTLDFFKLESLDSLFGVDIPESQTTVIYSPDLFDKQEKTMVEEDNDEGGSSSPILCSFVNKKRLRRDRKIELSQNEGFTKKIEALDLEDLFDFSFFEISSNKKDHTVALTEGTKSEKSDQEVLKCPTICNKSNKGERMITNADLKCKKNENIDDFEDFKDLLDIGEFTKPKISKQDEKSVLQQNCDGLKQKRLDSSFFKESKTNNVPESKKVTSESNISNKNEKKIEETSEIPCTPSQLSITQLITLMNKPTQINIAREENLNENIPDLRKIANGDLKCENDENIDDCEDHFANFLDIGEFPKPKFSKHDEIPDSLDFLDCFEGNIQEKSVLQQNCDVLKQKCLDSSVFKELKTKNISNNIEVTQLNNSQKENLNKNIPDLDNDFNFRFNRKKPKNSSSSSEKLNKSKHNTSIDTTLGSKSNNSSTNSVSKLNLSANTSYSDDDFETKPKSPGWIRRKKLIKKLTKHDSFEDFDTKIKSPVFARPGVVRKNKVRRGRSRGASGSNKKLINQFIEDEAELSICGEMADSDDETDFLSQDGYDESFVADNTIKDDTQMHAVYLESVRNIQPPNGFKIPTRFKNTTNIFSQEISEEEESYLDDSFVVEDELIESEVELSQLEILEKQLENRKRRKKIIPDDNTKPTKRKRIIVESDSD